MEKIKKLTKENAIELVADINGSKCDCEIAHTLEDHLRGWYINSCANGLYTKEEIIEIGEIVLSTNDINFIRWCA